MTGYKVQDTGTVIQTHSMRQDMDCRTVLAMRGEDSGRSVYSPGRNIFLHFRPEMAGNGGEQFKGMILDRLLSLERLRAMLKQVKPVMLQS